MSVTSDEGLYHVINVTGKQDEGWEEHQVIETQSSLASSSIECPVERSEFSRKQIQVEKDEK